MVGIIYNTEMVDDSVEEDGADDTGSWDLMWNEKYAGNILQFNNSRDAFGTAQYALGLDVNSSDESEWRTALEELRRQKPILQGYVMDEIFNKMQGGSAAIAAYYAGDFLTMYEENDSLEFYYPEEGTNLYIDAMCIPKTSNNKLAAERYINFMLSQEPAIANAEYTYYASPNKLVREDPEYIDYMNSIKDNGYDLMYDTASIKTQAYANLPGDQLAMINTLWEELKSDIDVSPTIYIICATIVVFLSGFAILFGLRKKFRNNY
jgi:spermidine/putrescine transport system substrate-binding protein